MSTVTARCKSNGDHQPLMRNPHMIELSILLLRLFEAVLELVLYALHHGLI